MNAMPADVTADPTVAGSGGNDDASAGPQGYVIEIQVGADGKISVSVEPQSEEDSEESGGASGNAPDADAAGGESEDSQPVANIREACKLVMEIFKSAGQMPDDGADQAAMSAGYGS
jgi:hypothetical protein